MPYASEKQRRFMWSQHPDIAKEWSDEGHGYVKKKSKKSPKKKGHGMGGSDPELSSRKF